MTKAELITIFDRVTSGEVVEVKVMNKKGEFVLLPIDKVQVYSDRTILLTPPDEGIEFK